jgi:hypothetical protein
MGRIEAVRALGRTLTHTGGLKRAESDHSLVLTAAPARFELLIIIETRVSVSKHD